MFNRETLILILIFPMRMIQANCTCSSMSPYQAGKLLKQGPALVLCKTGICEREPAPLLSGSIVRVTFLTSPGYLELGARSACGAKLGDCWSGYIPDIFNHLAETFNFSYQLQYARDNRFGSRNPKTGMKNMYNNSLDTHKNSNF